MVRFLIAALLLAASFSCAGSGGLYPDTVYLNNHRLKGGGFIYD